MKDILVNIIIFIGVTTFMGVVIMLPDDGIIANIFKTGGTIDKAKDKIKGAKL